MQDNLYFHSKEDAQAFLTELTHIYPDNNKISRSQDHGADIKWGLRNADGTGVMAGLTQVGSVMGYYMEDGEKVPMPGKLYYRGINVEDLIRGFVSEKRFGFEETAFLLLMGRLPNREELGKFTELLGEMRPLPPMFTEDMILKAPSSNVMNKIARSVLALYSYDDKAEIMTLENELRQAISLIARTPMIVAHAYAAKRCYFDGDSLYLHRAQDGMSLAENFLYAVRKDNKFTDSEAKLLDLCLVLHAEHGGGNNSAFTCRVISSSHTDFYSSIAAAVGSLKGPRHGGANKKVMEMFGHIEAEVSDCTDDDAVRDYLGRLLRKEAGDRSGLIYGMGHAIYTLSDPRAVILKERAQCLAEEKGFGEKLRLYETVERLSPAAFRKVTGKDKVISANVDFYSGLVYEMLGIPEDLFTPMFAVSRIAGWCAHRIEELTTGGRIMRPAYRALPVDQKYVPLDER